MFSAVLTWDAPLYESHKQRTTRRHTLFTRYQHKVLRSSQRRYGNGQVLHQRRPSGVKTLAEPLQAQSTTSSIERPRTKSRPIPSFFRRRQMTRMRGGFHGTLVASGGHVVHCAFQAFRNRSYVAPSGLSSVGVGVCGGAPIIRRPCRGVVGVGVQGKATSGDKRGKVKRDGWGILEVVIRRLEYTRLNYSSAP